MQILNRKKVIAAVIEMNSLFLLAQRGKQDDLYGKWEFPGGKVEGVESDQECLMRELEEEFGICAVIGDHICDVPFEHKDTPYVMRAYHVPSFTGELVLNEHLKVHWVSIADLSSYSVPDPDKPIITYLKNRYLIQNLP